ncbi:hypothetical protein Tco_1356117 [Tanacetum coccineum]
MRLSIRRGDSVERAITTDASLVAAQDRNGYRWQSQAPRNHRGAPTQTRSERVLKQPNEPPLPEGHTSGSGEGRMEHTFELMDIVPPTPHDSPLPGCYTPGSDEGRLKLEELMAMCTKLLQHVLDLDKEKDAQAVEILKLKKRVKKLERQRKSSILHPRRRIYMQVESSNNDLDEEDASKQGRNSDKTKPMFKDSDFDVLNDAIEDVDGSAAVQITTAGPSNISTADQVCTVRPEVSAVSVPVNVSVATPVTPPTTTTTVFDDDEDLTIAQTLVKMRSEKAKEKGVAFRDVEETPRLTRSTTTLQPLPTIDPNDKGKGVLVEEEPEKPEKVKKRDQGLAQIESDAELALRLHEEELAELERMQRERVAQEEASMAALYEEAQFLVETIAAQRNFRAAQRAVEIRSKPPTKTQLRNMMITYLKNKGKVNHNHLKGKSYEELRGLYEREQKWINDFVPMDSEKEEKKSVEPENVEDSSRPIRSITTLQPLPTIDPKDKGKGVLVEEELEKPEKEELSELDIAQKEKQKQEEATNAALAEEFDEIQARMDADHELVVRLTHEEQEKYTIEERITLLAEYFERRKKQLAAERPMDIKEDGSNTKKASKRIKRIADSTSKQKSPNKFKVIKEQESAESNAEATADYEQEKEELRMWLAVVPNKDETVDPELLSVKYPIVDWIPQNLGSDIHVYKIIRADGNTSYHKTFSSMLREFDRQDLMDLHRLVMKRFEDNTPEGYNLLLWGDLKVMFEPNAKDEIWSNQQDWTLISWKLYENCGVHLLLMDGTLTCFNMLVEKIYPLIKEMLEKMLNWKLEAEADSTMAFELLKFIKSQVEE